MTISSPACTGLIFALYAFTDNGIFPVGAQCASQQTPALQSAGLLCSVSQYGADRRSVDESSKKEGRDN